MRETNKYHIINLILSLIITLPIWYYLLFKILQYCEATSIMWFLYWIYVPIGILTIIISKIADME